MNEENCRFVLIYAFDSAHVEYGIIWIKVSPQLLFPAEQDRKNGWANSRELRHVPKIVFSKSVGVVYL